MFFNSRVPCIKLRFLRGLTESFVIASGIVLSVTLIVLPMIDVSKCKQNLIKKYSGWNNFANLSLIPEDWTQDFSDDLNICPSGQHLLTLTVCWAGTSWRGITRNRSPDNNLIVSCAAGNCQNICQDSGLGRMKAIILLDKLEHNGFKVEQRNKFQESLTIRNF